MGILLIATTNGLLAALATLLSSEAHWKLKAFCINIVIAKFSFDLEFQVVLQTLGYCAWRCDGEEVFEVLANASRSKWGNKLGSSFQNMFSSEISSNQ